MILSLLRFPLFHLFPSSPPQPQPPPLSSAGLSPTVLTEASSYEDVYAVCGSYAALEQRNYLHLVRKLCNNIYTNKLVHRLADSEQALTAHRNWYLSDKQKQRRAAKRAPAPAPAPVPAPVAAPAPHAAAPGPVPRSQLATPPSCTSSPPSTTRAAAARDSSSARRTPPPPAWHPPSSSSSPLTSHPPPRPRPPPPRPSTSSSSSPVSRLPLQCPKALDWRRAGAAAATVLQPQPCTAVTAALSRGGTSGGGRGRGGGREGEAGGGGGRRRGLSGGRAGEGAGGGRGVEGGRLRWLCWTAGAAVQVTG